MPGHPDEPLADLRPFRERLVGALAGVELGGPGGVVDRLARCGLGDGLPVVLPDEGSIEAVLGGRPVDGAATTGPLPISFATPTWWEVAACSVLAGCPPDAAGLVDVVAAALDAAADPAFNLLGVQTTTGAAAPLVVVHGPVVDRLGLNAGSGALGPGWRANATIGRAVRLALADVGLCRPGEGDMATHGHPGKYTWLVAENQQASPWEPLSVERGMAEGASAVTVFPGVGNVEVVLPATTPDDVVDRFAGVLAGVLAGSGAARSLVLVPPESADLLARSGWARQDLVAALDD
ncbi:MAG: hypothetical protein GEV08_23840, partial [Acidimicrobiia bacterium]|nr:hypothetical protein [Acidimicrobiia bacterium]